MTIRTILATTARTAERAAHWLFGVMCITVASARKDIDQGELKKVVTKLGLAVVTFGSVKAGFHNVVSDPETLWSLAVTTFLVLGAFVEGMAIYWSGKKPNVPSPAPDSEQAPQ